MLSNLKDLFKDANLRVKNTIVVGFICSFIVINWQVFVVLLTYKETGYVTNRYGNLLCYLETHFNFWNGLFFPLFSSLGINILISFLDMGLNIVKMLIKKTQTRSERSILSKQNVYMSYSDYDALKSEFEEKIEKINTDYATPKEVLINEKNEIVKSSDELKRTVARLEGNIARRDVEFGNYKRDVQASQSNLLDGVEFYSEDKKVYIKSEGDYIQIVITKFIVPTDEHESLTGGSFIIINSRFLLEFGLICCRDNEKEYSFSITFQLFDAETKLFMVYFNGLKGNENESYMVYASRVPEKIKIPNPIKL